MVDFIDELPDYDNSMYCHKKMKTNLENSKQALEALLPVLEAIPEESWNLETIHDKCFEVIAQLDVKNGVVLWPLRTAISGKQFTPGGGIDLAEILGKACTIERVKDGIARLS